MTVAARSNNEDENTKGGKQGLLYGPDKERERTSGVGGFNGGMMS